MPEVAVQLALGLRSLHLVEDAESKMRFAYAIRRALAQKGWKPTHLARALGVMPSTVIRWTDAESLPNILMVGPLADALEVDPELLYRPAPIPDYPISEFPSERLVRDATAAGVERGVRKDRRRRQRAADGSS